MPKRVGTHTLVMQELGDEWWTHHVEAHRGVFKVDLGGFGDVLAWRKGRHFETGKGPLCVQSCTFGHLEDHLWTCADRTVFPQLVDWLSGPNSFEIWCWLPKKKTSAERQYMIYRAYLSSAKAIEVGLAVGGHLRPNAVTKYILRKGLVT